MIGCCCLVVDPSPFDPFDCCYRFQQFMAGECQVLQHYLLPSIEGGAGGGSVILPFGGRFGGGFSPHSATVLHLLATQVYAIRRLTFAKIQFCALGCQEVPLFWRRFNAMESHSSPPKNGGGSTRYIIVPLHFGVVGGSYSLTIVFCRFVRKIHVTHQNT